MSKTRLFNAIKSLDLEAVSVLLGSHPELAKVKDERRRNALHFLCGLPASDRTSARSLALARLLLDRGFDINGPAFVEGGGAFKATPLWYTLSRGRNLALAKLLLKRGSSPEYCLWTAGFHDDVEAIDLLVKAGARLDPVAEDETPFLGAIKWSRFKAAERLLHHGANVNFQNSKGTTALHALVKKRCDRRYVELLLRHGADPHRRDAKGVSPFDMVARRRDKTLFHLFSR
jgi:ankyrin repeat protein